jgi:hypothetical protein
MRHGILVLVAILVAPAPGRAEETCQPAARSDLPGLRLALTSKQCSFSQADLSRGIRLEYELVVEREIKGITPLPQDIGGCQQANLAGLITFRSITGSGHSFCPQCDLGPCSSRERAAVTVRPGRYREFVLWNGFTYGGPSDGMSTVARQKFPPGRYVLRVSLRGQDAAALLRSRPRAAEFAVEMEVPLEVRP